MKVIIASLLFLVCTSCVSGAYHRTETGELKGELVVKWISPEKFIFEPVESDPLTFTRANGEEIRPGRMFTDGGSIPRPFRIFKNYSPWGYAPAFIVHDWLFTMKYCKLPGYEESSFSEAATIMSEIIKTMMVKLEAVDELTLYAMDRAVRSSIARKVYETGGCNQPKEPFRAIPIMEYVIKAP